MASFYQHFTVKLAIEQQGMSILLRILRSHVSVLLCLETNDHLFLMLTAPCMLTYILIALIGGNTVYRRIRLDNTPNRFVSLKKWVEQCLFVQYKLDNSIGSSTHDHVSALDSHVVIVYRDLVGYLEITANLYSKTTSPTLTERESIAAVLVSIREKASAKDPQVKEAEDKVLSALADDMATLSIDRPINE